MLFPSVRGFLFGMLAKELGYVIEAVQTGFPTARPSAGLLRNIDSAWTSNLNLRVGISATTATLQAVAMSLSVGGTIGTSAQKTLR